MRRAELFKFVNDQTVYAYTSADQAIEHAGDTYTPMPIGRGNVEISEEINQANIQVRMPVTNPLAQLHLTNSTDYPTTLTLFVQTDSIATFWKGRVASIKADDDEAIVECESVFTSLARPGLRGRFQRACRYALYDTGCNLDKDDFDAVVSVLDISSDGLTLSLTGISSEDDGYYSGGMLKAADGTYRFIYSHTESELVISRPIPSLVEEWTNESSVGETLVTVYPGCDHTLATCISKFNNRDNYGGFPWLPGETNNPFGGQSIV